MTRMPRQAGPKNTSRAAGAPAPASAAATAPRRAAPAQQPFFDPEAGVAATAAPREPSPTVARSELFGAESGAEPIDAGRVRESFNVETAAAAVPAPGGATADGALAQAAEGVEANDESLEQTIARIRSMRRPIGRQGGKLEHPPIPGYHLHWFNDDGARVEDAKLNGWAHVNDHRGTPVSRAVGTGRDKGVLFAFLMKIPEVFWKEDMQARFDEADARIEATKTQLAVLKPGEKTQAADKGKFYDPTESGAPITVHKG